MANALAIDMSPSAAVTATGASAAVDIGTVRSLVDLSVRVDSVSGTAPGIALHVETSEDGATAWQRLDDIPETIGAPGVWPLVVDECKRYVRLAWTLAGTDTPTFTLSATGYAHTLYATRSDMAMHAMADDALAQATHDQQMRALLAASSVADDYLSSAYTLPLSAWGGALSAHVARIAVYSLSMAVRVLGDDMVVDANTRATKYLKDLAEGRLRPATIVDATPAAQEDSAFIVSATSRGW